MLADATIEVATFALVIFVMPLLMKAAWDLFTQGDDDEQ
jgi:hypothetical protein